MIRHVSSAWDIETVLKSNPASGFSQVGLRGVQHFDIDYWVVVFLIVSKQKCNYVREEEYYGSNDHHIINGLCEEISCKSFCRLMSQAEYFGSTETCFIYDANRVQCLWLKSKFMMCSFSKYHSNIKRCTFNYMERIDLCALFRALSYSFEQWFPNEWNHFIPPVIITIIFLTKLAGILWG